MDTCCPYCNKERSLESPGRYECARCKGRFSISESGQAVKLGRPRFGVWLAVSAIIATTGLIIFIMQTETPSTNREIAENVIIGFGAFLMFSGFVITALESNELPSRGPALYKEDCPKFFIFGTVVYAVFSVVALIAAVIELLGIAHFRL